MAKSEIKVKNSEENAPLTIVGIGASAGGLNALKIFFQNVQENSGIAYVVVVHLSPEHKSMLTELLQPFSKIPVQQVTGTVAIRPDHVYVIPPGSHLNSIDTHLRLSKMEARKGVRTPIDHFFKTLGSTHEGHAIGVILTGTGSDGSLGIKEIKEKNGMIICQDPNEAEYDGMPQSAISTGMVDIVLPVAEIPKHINRFSETVPQLPALEQAQDFNIEESQLIQKILTLVRAMTGRDYSRYKMSTILRRLQRRMQLFQMQNLSEYLKLLRKDTGEVTLLANDFLITVTNFFRDPRVYEYLSEKIIPQIFSKKSQEDPIRIWSVGCATGEEAYSLAILLHEEADRHSVSPRMQIFASDLHEHSLKLAREGFYLGDIKADVSPERLRKYFTKMDGGFRIRKEIREMVIFTPHNLLGDPPFSRIDLIMCRNLLIYMNRDVQPEIFNLFHYSLKADGILVLGPSEHLNNTGLFKLRKKEYSVYTKKNVQSPEPRLPVFPLSHFYNPKKPQASFEKQPISSGTLHQLVLENYGPPSILINEDHQIMHLSESAGRYLSFPGGEPTRQVFKLLRDELKVDLRSTIHASKGKSGFIRSKPVSMKIDGKKVIVRLSVRSSGIPTDEPYILIMFEEYSDQEVILHPEREGKDDQSEKSFQTLEDELLQARQRLQSVIEEYDTTREEMKASNEELQSANEELRSTMEELETSKEELQSMNEELSTLNQENRHKVEELSLLSSDLQNLLAATNIATLFLDKAFRILRFTPRLGELFSIRPSDRGRPISDITHKLGYSELNEDCRKVLETLIPIEKELRDKDGSWYLTRLSPYRSTDDRIEGIVITFVDITLRKKIEEERQNHQVRVNRMLNIDVVGIITFNYDGFLFYANESFYKYTGYSRKEVNSRKLSWRDLTPAEYVEISEQEIGKLKKTGQMGPYEKEYKCKDGRRFWILVAGADLGDDTYIEYFFDITDKKKMKVALEENELHLLETQKQLALATKASMIGWGTWDPETGKTEWDDRGREILGLMKDDETIASWLKRVFPADRQAFEKMFFHATAENKPFDLVYRIIHPEKGIRQIHGTGTFAGNSSGNSTRGTGLVRDITRQVEIQQQKDEFIAVASHELKTPVSVLKGYVKMVEHELREKNENDLAESLAKVDKQVNRMNMLINDLLDISRIETGKINFRFEHFDFDLMVDETIKSMQFIAAQRIKLKGRTDKKVAADRDRTSQVLVNLISNAIKFSPETTMITVELSSENHSVICKVRDRGIGISREDQKKVFQRFSNIDSSSSRNKGLGIGLFISSEIIRRHDGKIWVESRKGKGSTFGFSLPAI